jgi:hypothetical protein
MLYCIMKPADCATDNIVVARRAAVEPAAIRR